MRRVTVLLADDHTMVAQGLASLLREEFDLVGIVGDGQALIDAAQRLRPDVIVADIAMPVMDGRLEGAATAHRGTPQRQSHLSDHARRCPSRYRSLARRRVRLRAETRCGRGTHHRHARGPAGGTYLTPLIAKDVITSLLAPEKHATVTLTPRQREVLQLIAEGRRMKEIAATLQLSPRTVETHKYEMMRALGVQSTAELVRYAIHLGLVAG